MFAYIFLYWRKGLNMIRKAYLGILKKFKFLPPERFVQIYYEYYFGMKLDLKNPKSFNQKIQWLKVYYQPKILNRLVDKFEVRSYVKDKIGAEFLNHLILVTDDIQTIDFKSLPQSFVIKATHGCNFNLLVRDKSDLNIFKTRLLLKKWLSKNQYYRGGLEWAYRDIPPRIIIEDYLEEENRASLCDYKFYCFDGQPKYIQLDIGRGYHHQRSVYNSNWELQSFNKGKFTNCNDIMQKPENLSEMLVVASKLADKFPFVRVDLYNLSGRIVFGEMTFYPGDGRQNVNPCEYDDYLGSLIKLPKIPENDRYIT